MGKQIAQKNHPKRSSEIRILEPPDKSSWISRRGLDSPRQRLHSPHSLGVPPQPSVSHSTRPFSGALCTATPSCAVDGSLPCTARSACSPSAHHNATSLGCNCLSAERHLLCHPPSAHTDPPTTSKKTRKKIQARFSNATEFN